MAATEKKYDVWQGLMNQAYDRYQQNNNWSYEQFLAQCSPTERIACLFGNLNYQVENGGFCQWVDNGYALKGMEVVILLRELDKDLKVPIAKELAQRISSLLEFVDLSKKNRGWDDYWKRTRSCGCCERCEEEEDAEGIEEAQQMDNWYYNTVQPTLQPAIEKWLSQKVKAEKENTNE